MRIQTLAALGAVGLIAGVAAGCADPAAAQGESSERAARHARTARHMALLEPGGQIGVSVREVDEGDVAREKLPAAEGAVIEEVMADAPAARAGLRAGDVVVAFDGERVRSARQFGRLVRETPPGRQVSLAVLRGGERQMLEVTVEEATWFPGRLPDMERIGRDIEFAFRDFEMPEIDIDVHPRSGRLGVSVHRLNEQLAEYFGVEAGVLITSVADDSAAARAGLLAGDVITGIDGASVEDAGDLRRAIRGREAGREVTMAVVRDRKPLVVKVTIER